MPTHAFATLLFHAMNANKDQGNSPRKSVLNSDLTNFLHRQRLAMVIWGALGLVSLFLPWIDSPGSPMPFDGEWVSGLEYFGGISQVVLLPYGMAILFAFADGDRLTPVSSPMRWLTRACAGLGAAFGLYFIFGLIAIHIAHPTPEGMRARNIIGAGSIVWTVSGLALVLSIWLLGRQKAQDPKADETAIESSAETEGASSADS